MEMKLAMMFVSKHTHHIANNNTCEPVTLLKDQDNGQVGKADPVTSCW